MPLSKERNRARCRNDQLVKTGQQPTATQIIEPLSAQQRKERLAELIVTPLSPEQITPKHVIMAIDVYNKMTKEYIEQPTAYQDNRQINIIIQGGDRTREDIERLLSGDMPPLAEMPGPDNESIPDTSPGESGPDHG